jgi:hypothetical protein
VLKYREGLTISSPVWLLPPKNTIFSLGSRSIIILNVNQRFARANQEKISENMLYCTTNINQGTGDQLSMTYKGLNVEEEHADDTMARLVKSEEVHNSILRSKVSDYT